MSAKRDHPAGAVARVRAQNKPPSSTASSSPISGDDILLRPYEADDTPAVLDLLHATRTAPPSPHDEDLFRWKHLENHFGPSAACVATASGRLVGFRTFMRWEFVENRRTVRAVRAVDAATHPDYQGRKVFTRLTLLALEGLARDGVAFVFNTPNSKTLPGNLKMGWQPIGTVVAVPRPRSPLVLTKVARARTAAEKWSLSTDAGEPAADLLRDRAQVNALLSELPAPAGLRTHLSAGYLAWRYSFGPLAYRAMLAGPSIRDGMVIFRLRRRGQIVEAAVADVLLPRRSQARRGQLIRRMLRESGADAAVRLGPVRSEGKRSFLPGPKVVWRGVCDTTMPPTSAWHFSLGDIELF